MTALNAAILFNNSTGSDTQSSGSSAGANVYGSGASTTSGSSIVTGIITTGIQAGDLLWVQSSSGRQFSVIASVDSGTQVTCDDTFANTESSRTWAIGGKRAGSNLATDSIWSDAPSGAVIEIEHTGTDYSLSGQWVPNNLGAVIKIKGTGSSKPRIIGDSGLGQGIRVNNGTWTFENLVFVLERAGGTLMQTTYGTASYNLFVDCEFAHEGLSAGGTLVEITRATPQTFVRCKFLGNNLAQNGIYQWYSFAASHAAKNCHFSGFTNYAIYVQRGQSDRIAGNVFTDCASCIYFGNQVSGGELISGNIFHDISSNAILIDYNGALRGSVIESNVFSSVTSNAISASAAYTEELSSIIDRNAFYNVGSSHNNLTAGTNDITLTADPFVDAAGSPPDFNLNADAGGGATLRANNFSLNTDTAVYPFRQYVSDAFGAGGGGAVLHPLRSN